ncbi:Wound-induced protein WIN1 [Linum perenne]
MLSLFSVSISADKRADSRCYDYYNGTYDPCGTDRCCTYWNYCSGDHDICSDERCLFQCPETSAVLPTAPAADVGVVNATCNGYYDHDVSIVGTSENDDVALSSSSCSCASSLINVPRHLLRKYNWAAAFRRDRSSASTCGRCLKLRNLKSGTEAMVRIVHEHTAEGIELNNETFKKLSDKDDVHDDHLVLKYHLTSCED